ncbi:MAG: hypothetical protein WBZ15_25510 [Mycobacterium sp.]|uniref:hypothetical protein n=1 Tax=Mycobacterium sp. TaxID=1785 RepID=UPI003C3E9E72
MEHDLHIDTGAVHVMASRWQALAADLGARREPEAMSGLSCQASAAAVHVGHGDVTAGTAIMAARLREAADRVAAANARFVVHESDSAATLSAVVDPVRGV